MIINFKLRVTQLIIVTLVVFILALSVVLPVQASSPNPFGIMTWGKTNSIKVQIANNLGSEYYRPLSIFLTSWQGVCPECDAAVNGGLKLILTVRDNENANPSANLNQFKNMLARVLNKYTPEVLVVENEENSNRFYKGTAKQYLAELSAGCTVAHSKDVKCANGGLVSKLVVVLVSQNYINNGDPNRADDYLRRALSPDDYSGIYQWISSPVGQAQIKRGQDLLAGYKTAGADFVNFHWYQADEGTLTDAVAYLSTASKGLPVFTNEAGQQQNTDPNQVTSFMQKAVDLNLPYAVWFSSDTNGTDGAMALTDFDGTLRDNGKAYQQFVLNNFSTN
ncbi:hypothetical protein HYU90_02695 [Candidatus Collierbacteria bacterium]|nr:hypothetical protein [Candidatus Collierbacteria bacterium]